MLFNLGGGGGTQLSTPEPIHISYLIQCHRLGSTMGSQWTTAEYQKLFKSYMTEESYTVDHIEGRIPSDLQVTIEIVFRLGEQNLALVSKA